MAQKTPSADDRAATLGKGLRAMFRALQNRPIPDRLRSVVDQLDEGEPQPERKAGRS